MGGMISNVGEVAIATLVVSRFLKVIGEKEIGELVTGIGVLMAGVYIVQGFMPLANGIQEFGSNVSEGIQGLNNFFDKLTFWN